MKTIPVIFIMLAVVFVALAIIHGVASFYGSADWTWIAETVVGFVVLFMVVGVSLFTLMGVLKKR